ncbi:GNAT family N-acetyltransferase [Actinotalea soli]|uniref:GNAT family N-acetyltransferase n=1 Tax=Actinotalea soli TaxID=2819234 RepID=UPI0027DB448A|nr:GNAT family N-acetyltransferase [Actinotalea soli]
MVVRPGIVVGQAQPEDIQALVALCLAARRESVVGPQVCSPDGRALAQQLGALMSAPGGTVLVAREDGGPTGLLLARVLGPTPFADDVSLAVEAVYVDRAHRRRGVGHALMAAAAQVAVEAGADVVYAAPIPGARGMQRFFVQLGFAPAATHRVVTTTALQRRLAIDATAASRAPGRGLDDLIARRRHLRLALPGEEPGEGRQSARRSISKQVRRAVQTRRDAESSTTIS